MDAADRPRRLLGVRRFADFIYHLRIPRAVLASRLKTLVAAGSMTRVAGERHLEYVLTGKGTALWPVVLSCRRRAGRPVGAVRGLRRAGARGGHHRRPRSRARDLVPTPPWYRDDGELVLATSLQHGLEGVVGKPLASRYHPGGRRDWIKVKNVWHQEVIICGWRPGEGRRANMIGSLIPGVYDGDQSRYAGNVGTGSPMGNTRRTRRAGPRAPFPSCKIRGNPVNDHDQPGDIAGKRAALLADPRSGIRPLAGR